ncbi:CueP family metal-binding protein [Pseudoclavibacter helvolus]|uniref:CueP family metal-binding protein n=1 Tax=Pseudoclavibacter helvolus TaxID=255205 RepID=UPI0024AD16CC|nr:CueP family metal-binding protein [Pseudoclavibacter helvolus]
MFRSLPKGGGKNATVIAVVGALMLTGCTPSPAPIDDTEIFAEYDLDGLDVRELVETLDAMPLDERTETFTASIDATTVRFTDQHEHTAEVQLPGDEIYVSIAPYQLQTHDCYNHSPTGCLGELRNTELRVTATDTATGDAILEGNMTTFDNGFVGIWLPRDIQVAISITYDGQTATSKLSTAGEDAQTCLTTMRLT